MDDEKDELMCDRSGDDQRMVEEIEEEYMHTCDCVDVIIYNNLIFIQFGL